jgi:hypothetical protein
MGAYTGLSKTPGLPRSGVTVVSEMTCDSPMARTSQVQALQGVRFLSLMVNRPVLYESVWTTGTVLPRNNHMTADCPDDTGGLPTTTYKCYCSVRGLTRVRPLWPNVAMRGAQTTRDVRAKQWLALP